MAWRSTAQNGTSGVQRAPPAAGRPPHARYAVGCNTADASMPLRGDMWISEALVQVARAHHPILRRIVSGCGGRQAAA